MSIRHHAMRPKDISVCVDLVARHPTLGPRYGSSIADLRPALLRLLGRKAFFAVVLEEIRALDVRVPFPWIGPELARRVMRDQSPLLADAEVRKANSGTGLNLVVRHTGVLPGDQSRPDVVNEASNSFLDSHRGFLLKELLAQAESLEHLQGMRSCGGLFLNPDGSYNDFLAPEPYDFTNEPCNIGVTREKALAQLSSWVFLLFFYQPPQFGFCRSEQRLLLCALDGRTGGELADTLQISVSAVKKMWHSIYDRVAVCLPELLPYSVTDAEPSERGKEKKRLLLAYLRDHPEELRPVLRRFLKEKHWRALRTSA